MQGRYNTAHQKGVWICFKTMAGHIRGLDKNLLFRLITVLPANPGPNSDPAVLFFCLQAGNLHNIFL
jgi:hypothetical protein